MHPSGLYVAFACEGDVREFAITDSSLDLMKKTSTKTSFVGPTGIPFNITQPVSLVIFSEHTVCLIDMVFHFRRSNTLTVDTF